MLKNPNQMLKNPIQILKNRIEMLKNPIQMLKNRTFTKLLKYSLKAPKKPIFSQKILQRCKLISFYRLETFLPIKRIGKFL